MNETFSADMQTPQGRQIKFTPERLEQIRNLVERGMSRQEIADTIGCTLVASDVLTCGHQPTTSADACARAADA